MIRRYVKFAYIPNSGETNQFERVSELIPHFYFDGETERKRKDYVLEKRMCVKITHRRRTSPTMWADVRLSCIPSNTDRKWGIDDVKKWKYVPRHAKAGVGGRCQGGVLLLSGRFPV